MRTICAALMRGVVMAVLVSAALAATPSIASAQVGVGARLAWVKADTLYGWQTGRSTPHAVAVADVRRAEERRLSPLRTTLLVVGIPVAVILGLAAAISATPGGPGL